MDGYYVVGVTTISYLGFVSIINIVFKEERTYFLSIACNPLHALAMTLRKWSSMAVGKRGQCVSCKQLYYVFEYLCKVDYTTDKFIHTLTFNYNEVMSLIKLMGVIEQA
jgi:hypothetical protein